MTHGSNELENPRISDHGGMSSALKSDCYLLPKVKNLLQNNLLYMEHG